MSEQPSIWEKMEPLISQLCEAYATQVTRERDILAEKLRRWVPDESGDVVGEPMVPLAEFIKERDDWKRAAQNLHNQMLNDLRSLTKERDALRARVERMRVALIDLRYNISSWSAEERDAKIEAALADAPRHGRPCDCGAEFATDHSEFGLPLGFDRHCRKCGQMWRASDAPLPAIGHAGDCTIYSSLSNGNPEDGICTCGYGRSTMAKAQGDLSQMYSEERLRHGIGRAAHLKEDK